MGFSEEMKNLGENFLDSFDDRIRFMGKNRFEVKKMKQDTHRFMNELKSERKAMGRKLRTTLNNFTDHLTETVDKMLGGCKKHRHQLHQELKTGHQAYQHIAKEMANRRRGSFAQVKKNEQTFEHHKKAH